MGLFTIAVVAAARSSSRSRAATAQQVRAQQRKREITTATPLFSAQPPTRDQVIRYLRTQYHTTSPTQAAAIKLQLDALRYGYPYEVTADPSTGKIRVQILPRPAPAPDPTLARALAAAAANPPPPPEWRRNPDTWTTQQEIDYNYHQYMVEREERLRRERFLKEQKERDEARYKKLR